MGTRLHRIFDFLATGGGSILTRKSVRDDDPCECGEDTIIGCAYRPSRHCGATEATREGE